MNTFVLRAKSNSNDKVEGGIDEWWFLWISDFPLDFFSIKGLKILIVQEKPLKYGYLSLFCKFYKTNDEGWIKFSLKYAVSENMWVYEIHY